MHPSGPCPNPFANQKQKERIGNPPRKLYPLRMNLATDSATKLHRIIGIEAFKAGDYGDKGSYSVDDLDAIAASYNPSLHSAALKFDHIDQGPAAGWVSRVYRSGEKLLVDVVNASKEAADGLIGAWKNRSAEIYRDFEGTGKPYLRGLALLGSAAPHVKGLAHVTPEQIAAMKDAGERFITLSGDTNGAFAFYDYGMTSPEGYEAPEVEESTIPAVWSTYGPPKGIGPVALKTMVIVDSAGCEENRCHKHRVDLTADANGWTSPPVWCGPNTPGDEHQHTVTAGKIDAAPDGFGVMHTHEIELTLEDKIEGHLPIPEIETEITIMSEKTITDPTPAPAVDAVKFGEMTSALARQESEILALKAQNAAIIRRERDTKFDAAWAAAFTDGRVTEAQKPQTLAIFNAFCDSATDSVNFGESGSLAPADAFLSELRSRPIIVPVGQRIEADPSAVVKLAERPFDAKSYKFGDPESQVALDRAARKVIAERNLGVDKYQEIVTELLAGA